MVAARPDRGFLDPTVIRDSFKADRLKIPYSKIIPSKGRRQFAKGKK